jgi:hypothetical protein
VEVVTCKAITSLVYSGVESSMISAAFKTTVNLELGNLTSVSSKQLGTRDKARSDWENTF